MGFQVTRFCNTTNTFMKKLRSLSHTIHASASVVATSAATRLTFIPRAFRDLQVKYSNMPRLSVLISGFVRS